MAITLSFSKNPAVIGDSVTITTSGDGAYTNFSFMKDGVALDSDPRSTYTIESVKLTDAGVYTVEATMSGGDTETSPPVTLAVNKKTITGFTLEMNLDKSSYTVGDTYVATATPSEVISGAVYTYEWTVNGVVKTETGATLTGYAEAKGTLTVVCNVKISSPDYDTYTSPNVNKQATISNKVMNTTMTLSSDKDSYKAGDSYTISAIFEDLPTGSPQLGLQIGYVYDWKIDGQHVSSSDKLTGTFEEPESLNITLDVLLVADYYDNKNLSDSISVTATEIVPTDGFAYIHPLPWRDSAFIQIGWWVIDEIQRANQLGLNWKFAPDPLRYKRDLLTLAKMFDDYDTVEVQESRNGYIWGKDQIEAGYGLM